MSIDALLAGVTVFIALQVAPAVMRSDPRPGAFWTAAATGALIWQAADPWIPATHQDKITNSLVAVLLFSVAATLYALRAKPLQQAAVAGLAAAAATVMALRTTDAQLWRLLVGCAAAAWIIALGSLVRQVFEPGTRAAQIWSLAVFNAVCVSVGVVALKTATMPRWMIVLTDMGVIVSGAMALLLAQLSLLMRRYPAFADAYTTPGSPTQSTVLTHIIAGALLPPLAIPPPVILSALHAPAWLVLASLILGPLALYRFTGSLWGIQDAAARHRTRTEIAGTDAKLRDDAETDSIYRLLPGLRRKRP